MASHTSKTSVGSWCEFFSKRSLHLLTTGSFEELFVTEGLKMLMVKQSSEKSDLFAAAAYAPLRLSVDEKT